MINYLIRRVALVPAIVAFLASGASAATIAFNGTVTSIPGVIPAGAVFPPIGTAGTVTLDIDDSNPAALLFDMGSFFQGMAASVDVPGYLSGSMSALNPPNYQPASFSFGAYGPSVLDQPGGLGLFPTGYHVFSFNYGAGTPQPSTVGDLILALSAADATGYFSHELDRQGGGFFFTRVEFSGGPSVVPLPGGVPLLLGALLMGAGLASVQRRKAFA